MTDQTLWYHGFPYIGRPYSRNSSVGKALAVHPPSSTIERTISRYGSWSSSPSTALTPVVETSTTVGALQRNEALLPSPEKSREPEHQAQQMVSCSTCGLRTLEVARVWNVPACICEFLPSRPYFMLFRTHHPTRFRL